MDVCAYKERRQRSVPKVLVVRPATSGLVLGGGGAREVGWMARVAATGRRLGNPLSCSPGKFRILGINLSAFPASLF